MLFSSLRLADFTGYWRLIKAEGFDDFLRDLGFPWVVRKVRAHAVDEAASNGPIEPVRRGPAP